MTILPLLPLAEAAPGAAKAPGILPNQADSDGTPGSDSGLRSGLDDFAGLLALVLGVPNPLPLAEGALNALADQSPGPTPLSASEKVAKTKKNSAGNLPVPSIAVPVQDPVTLTVPKSPQQEVVNPTSIAVTKGAAQAEVAANPVPPEGQAPRAAGQAQWPGWPDETNAANESLGKKEGPNSDPHHSDFGIAPHGLHLFGTLRRSDMANSSETAGGLWSHSFATPAEGQISKRSEVLPSTLLDSSADKNTDERTSDLARTESKDLPAHSARTVSGATPDALMVSSEKNSAGQLVRPAHPAPAAAQVAGAITSRVGELKPGSQTTLQLHLDPPGLGTVRVHLTATDHTVSARLVVQAEATREILQSQAGLLRDKLTESGVTLGQFAVACDSGGGGQHWQQDDATRVRQPAAGAGSVRAGLAQTAPRPLASPSSIDVIV